jgi:hypothetical protein
MMRKVVHVKALDDFKLELEFSSGDRRVFDARPYLEKGIFTELKDPDYFRSVRVSLGTVTWPNEQDFSPETLWLESQPLVAGADLRAAR